MDSSKKRLIVMVLVGVLIAGSVIAGVNGLIGQGLLPSGVTTARVITSTTVTSVSTAIETTVENSNLSGWTSTPTGTLAVLLTDSRIALGGVTHVFVGFSDAEVQTMSVLGNTSAWLTVSPPGAMDLMSVVSRSVTLGSSHVLAGFYDRVRLDIKTANVTFDGKNYTAAVESGIINVPIGAGGLSVAQDSDTGFILDVSPTLLPPQGGGGNSSFVFVPAARAQVVPASVWNASLDQQDASLQLEDQNWWVGNAPNELANITVFSKILSHNVLVLVVKNFGKSNVTISSVTILTANASLWPKSASPSFGASQNTSTYEPIATFLVIGNGSLNSLAQYALQITNGSISQVGISLGPGQLGDFASATQSHISTIMNASSLPTGQQYLLEISDQFGDTTNESIIAYS